MSTNRLSVTLHFFSQSQAHHVSSYDQQWVGDSTWIPLHGVLSCLIPWPTGSKQHLFTSLPGSLINHCYVSSHDHREWVTLPLYFFARLSHQSLPFLIPWPQGVSDTVPFISLPTTSLSWPTQLVVSLVKFWVSQTVSLPTVSEWHAIFVSHFSSYDKQFVSDNLFIFHVVYYPMINRMWVIHYLVITCILLHEQQEVSGFVLHLSKKSIKSHFMANRESVMLWHIVLSHFMPQLISLWQNVSVAAFLSARHPHLIQQQIESECGCSFAVQIVSHLLSKRVSSAIVLDRLISAHPMTNSK